MTRGLVEHGTVDGYIVTTVEMLVGALIVAGSSAWSQFRRVWSLTWYAAL